MQSPQNTNENLPTPAVPRPASATTPPALILDVAYLVCVWAFRPPGRCDVHAAIVPYLNLRPLQFAAACVRGNKCVIDEVSGKGDLDVLEWWFAHSPPLFFDWSKAAMDAANADGHLDIAKCLPHSQLKYAAVAIDKASSKEHLEILNGLIRHALGRPIPGPFQPRFMHNAVCRWSD
ncbi:hypothetical protein BCR44DRAFT_1497597 [Catenaria anguillulae PL171]|uniref:Uncharacterized protein n=1 Tax=Catenaria anguillulae PL171 TaxID=765915 RepID=A0A1Y2HWD5_9FUNG|nr:hypothetical protein BCR44DRAFT_1497597 [Catenaria anguillulae PL171]